VDHATKLVELVACVGWKWNLGCQSDLSHYMYSLKKFPLLHK